MPAYDITSLDYRHVMVTATPPSLLERMVATLVVAAAFEITLIWLLLMALLLPPLRRHYAAAIAITPLITTYAEMKH